MQMEMFIKGNEIMINLMGLENIFIMMELDIEVSGLMISSEDMEKKFDLMGLNIKELILKE